MADIPVLEFSRPFAPEALEALGDELARGEADEAERTALAGRLQVPDVRDLNFAFKATPTGEGGWRITGMVEAELVQTCVVTLEPITKRLSEAVDRRFVPAAHLPPVLPGGDFELDAVTADGPDGFTNSIDLGEVAAEAVALAIDPYPRRPDAGFEGVIAAPEGVEPLTDEAARPFAGLASLKARLPRS